MALLSYALTTVARLKTFLGVTTVADDTLLESIVNAVTEFVEGYCDRRFKQTTYTDEKYDGTGRANLLLRNWPVDTATAVVVKRRSSLLNINDWVTLSSDLFIIDYRNGIVTAKSGSDFYLEPQYYSLTYKAGYDFDNSAGTPTMDTAGLGDLEYAVWKLCAAAYKNRKSDPTIQSERIGDYSVTFRVSAMEDSQVKSILDSYSRLDSTM